MDFSAILASIFASLLLFIRECFSLIFYPYQTMRRIAKSQDMLQIAIIFLLIGLYFSFAYEVKNSVYHPLIPYLVFCAHFLATLVFFYVGSKLMKGHTQWSSFLFTFSYALIPTLIWFSVNSFLFVAIPPPRTLSLLGKSFSIVFTAFSLSLLAWKAILVYLALRFSTGLKFYRLIYLLILYLCIFLPYCYFLYFLHIFRVPFI